MAISFGALGTKAVTGTSTIVVDYPTGLAAGQLAVVARGVWNTVGATPTSETGWSSLGSLFGGNAGGSVDNHRLYARGDVRELDGSESGSVTFDQNAPDGVVAIMATYLKDSGEAWAAEVCYGDDATQGANRAITGDATFALQPGDWIVALVGTNTDTSLTITSPTFTASGITFGSVTRRTSGAGSATGQDGNVEIFDAAVTSGTATVTPSLAFTTATSQSGPAVFLKLRAVPGTTNVTPNDATHAHAAESPAITQTHVVAPAEASHAHSAETPSITQVHEVAPADASHGHTAESPTILQIGDIAPGDAAHAHSAESPAITQLHVVAPNDATHGHTAESPVLTGAGIHSVAPNDASHAHAAESPAITQLHVVSPNDGHHNHTAESPVLFGVLGPTPPRTTTPLDLERTTTPAACRRTSTPASLNRTTNA